MVSLGQIGDKIQNRGPKHVIKKTQGTKLVFAPKSIMSCVANKA
jgi:hypothetical protein